MLALYTHLRTQVETTGIYAALRYPAHDELKTLGSP